MVPSSRRAYREVELKVVALCPVHVVPSIC